MPGANHSGDTCMDIETINNTAVVNPHIIKKFSGRSLFVYLFVCLSLSAHALIGCLEFGLFLYVEGAREGGQRFAATAKQPRAA